jgi:hypothetical protein
MAFAGGSVPNSLAAADFNRDGRIPNLEEKRCTNAEKVLGVPELIRLTRALNI